MSEDEKRASLLAQAQGECVQAVDHLEMLRDYLDDLGRRDKVSVVRSWLYEIGKLNAELSREVEGREP